MSNFIDPDIIKHSDDITAVDFTEKEIQFNDSELGIGTSTRMLLCDELDHVVGTTAERNVFGSIRTFVVSKMLAKFPFQDVVLKELSLLDPRNRNKSSLNDVIQLASRFTSFSVDKFGLIINWIS